MCVARTMDDGDVGSGTPSGTPAVSGLLTETRPPAAGLHGSDGGDLRSGRVVWSGDADHSLGYSVPFSAGSRRDHAAARKRPRPFRSALCVAVWLAEAALGLEVGEFAIELSHVSDKTGRPIPLPAISELERFAKDEQIRPVVFFRMYGSRNHHYVPRWSLDGRSLAFLEQDIEGQTTKAMIMLPVSDPKPRKILEERTDSYEYMFSWSRSRPHDGYVMSSTAGEAENMDVHFGPQGGGPIQVTRGQGMKMRGSLHTSGGRCRILYEFQGDVYLAASALPATTGSFTIERVKLGRQPMWSTNGDRFVYCKERGKSAGQHTYDLYLASTDDRPERHLRLPPGMVHIRSPRFSPDENRVAVFASADQKEWNIVVVPIKRSYLGAVIAAKDVVMDEQFGDVSPAWGPFGRKVFFFSKQGEVQAHYPLRWRDVESGRTGQIPYPRQLTTANDVAVAPHPDAASLAFSAVGRTYADIYVMILNHF